MGHDRASALLNMVNDNMLQTVELVKNTTGIDLLDVLKQRVGKADIAAGETE